jgi:hypothetical protein
MAVKYRKKKRRGRRLANLIGLIGAVCIAVAAVGLIQSAGGREAPGPGEVALRPATPTAAEKLPLPREGATADSAAGYYPLEVGRYWVYVRRDPASGTVTELERRIVRRESRPDQDLYFFSDGVMAFQQEGRIFEISPEGGVNVIPVGTPLQGTPYVYHSQQLRIEKEIGARDTLLVLDGQRFPGCVQVITRFRREDRQDTMAYASYYARGVGLVGQELWPRQTADEPTERLKDYGPRQL